MRFIAASAKRWNEDVRRYSRKRRNALDRGRRPFLQSLLQEVIVGDDGSTYDTAQVSQTAGAKVIRNAANCGLVKSTRFGLRAASGDKWWCIHQICASNHSNERGRNHK